MSVVLPLSEITDYKPFDLFAFGAVNSMKDGFFKAGFDAFCILFLYFKSKGILMKGLDLQDEKNEFS